MNSVEYLDIFDANRASILAAGERGLDAAVAGCPGWDVGALIGHIGGVYMFWNKWVRDRPVGAHTEGVFTLLSAERDGRLPGYSAWREAGFMPEARPEGVLAFAQEAGDELAGRLRDIDQGEYVWTFFPPNQTAGFIHRRIAQETTIHRWDAEAAHGSAESVSRELADDGIDEYVTMALASGDPSGKEKPDKSVRFQLLPSDGGDPWTVEFGTEAPVVSRDRIPADVMIRGTSSDLLLYVWGRMPASRLHVAGETALAGKWAEFAGRF